MRQHRPGHLDRIVKGERAHDARRRTVYAREAVRELGARAELDIGRELLQHVVEHRDLLAGIVARARREQVGNPQHDAQSAFGVARGDGVVEFVDQGERGGGRGNIAAKRSIGHDYNQCLWCITTARFLPYRCEDAVHRGTWNLQKILAVR